MPCGGFVNNHDRSGCFRRRQSDQSSRVDAPVFGGMLAASVFGIFIIPMLYVVFQQLRERVAGSPEPLPVNNVPSDASTG